MINFIAVALGGALGAAGRYSISLIPTKAEFPVLTLLTNFLGALLIGFVVGISGKRGWSEKCKLFWKTGVCGGFTTFSTFSLESWKLLEGGRWGYAGLYICLSVIFCLAGVAAGQYISLHS